MSVRVTAVDTETGDRSECTIEPGNYTVIAVEPCRLEFEQHYLSGTTVLTLTGRKRNLLGTILVEPSEPDGAKP